MGFAKGRVLIAGAASIGIGAAIARVADKRVLEAGEAVMGPVESELPPEPLPMNRAERRRALKEERKAADRVAKRHRQIMGKNRYEA